MARLLLAAAGLGLASGETYYVSPLGSDSAPGTAEHSAWLTLGAAKPSVGDGPLVASPASNCRRPRGIQVMSARFRWGGYD